MLAFPRTKKVKAMELTINGSTFQVDVEPDTPLLWVLRDTLGMTGTKYGCGVAQCGACTVLIDGQATRSCVTTVDGVVGTAVTTIEAIEQDTEGRKVVEAWVANQVPQCGYCQSGQVMAATALLKQTPQPTEEDIAGAMVNLCRCGTYNAISAAVRQAAQA
ncbi:(2Fe-2S)-binding protein [Mesorhizobium sp. L-2-11]|nr:(2Fe-2S)-binding protein [Mesorhizobium sp. L-2-11]